MTSIVTKDTWFFGLLLAIWGGLFVAVIINDLFPDVGSLIRANPFAIVYIIPLILIIGAAAIQVKIYLSSRKGAGKK